MHPYRPRLSLAAMRELFGFSKWLQVAQIVSFASGRAADFIIGKAAGISALGNFTIGKEIANLPSVELAMPVHRGIFPGYAKLAGNLSLLKRAYLRVTSVLVLVTLPAGIGLALVAQPLVRIFLGENWNDAVPLIQILAINGVVGVSLSTAAYVYLALGTTRRTASLTAVHVAVSLPAMLFLVPFLGVEGAAFALLAGTLATVPANFRMMSDAIELTLREIGGVVWRPFLATIVMVGVVLVGKQYWMSTATLSGNAVNLVTAAGLGAVAYCGTVMLLWRLASCPDGPETFVLERVRTLAAAFRSRVGRWGPK
jgi:O-antigen/teichoic acid export membrane protein